MKFQRFLKCRARLARAARWGPPEMPVLWTGPPAGHLIWTLLLRSNLNDRLNTAHKR